MVRFKAIQQEDGTETLPPTKTDDEEVAEPPPVEHSNAGAAGSSDAPAEMPPAGESC